MPIPISLTRRIVRLQNTRLRFIRLRESIPALFAHALHLTHFANGFLELFHTAIAYQQLFVKRCTTGVQHTEVCNPEYYTSESPERGGTIAESTSFWHTSMQSLLSDTVVATRKA